MATGKVDSVKNTIVQEFEYPNHYIVTTTFGEPIFYSKTFGAEYSGLNPGGTKTFSKEDCGFFIPDGYEIFGISGISSGSMYVNICTFDPFSDDFFITIRNYSSGTSYDHSGVSGTARIRVCFIKCDYKELYVG